jgi:PAS domain S-box-containing protein
MPETIRVLYVDDEPGLLELAKAFLEDSDTFSVTTSPSAVQSLASPDLVSFDAIISDYQMPEIDGIAFLKNVRKQSPDIPFILFTGRGREEVVIDAINNGADFYLQKGGDPEALFAELAHKVRQAVVRRKSEREITSIFQAVPVGIAVVADRVLVRVNDHLCTITGYPRVELEGRNTRFLYLNDEDYQEIGRMREQAYRGGDPDTIEVRWQRKDGTIIDVQISAAAIDRSNPLAAMTYSALDITNAKKNENGLRAAYEQITASEEELRQQYDELAISEKALRESQARLRAFMDSADDTFSIWDANLNLVDINKAGFTYFPPGTTREKAIGKPYTALFPYPGSRERAEMYRQVIKTGIPLITTLEIPNPRTGERNWHSIRVFRAGEGLGITSTDITTIKNAELELRAAYEQLKTSETMLREKYGELARSEERSKRSETEITSILRAAPVSIGLISADRVFQRVNDHFCEMIGYSRDEIVGRTARFLYPDDEEYTRAGKFYGLRAGQGSVMTLETRFVRKDGVMRDVRLYGTLIDPANPAAGNIFIALDSTDEKRKGGELKQAV